MSMPVAAHAHCCQPELFYCEQYFNLAGCQTSHPYVCRRQRLLLRAALEDPLNQRFVFLSEACAPLIPAATMYAQLMSESKSRINACNKPDWDRNLDRSASA